MTSYSNSGGRGDRTGLVTVTISDPTLLWNHLTEETFDPAVLVDGDYHVKARMTPEDSSGESWIKFDWGEDSRKIIDGFIFWNVAGSFGSWQWYGSDDDVTYDALGSDFILHGASGGGPAGAGVELLEPAGNVTGYRYYRLTQLSGPHSGNQAQRFVGEMDFRIGAAVDDGDSEHPSEVSEPESEEPIDPDYSNPGGMGDRTALIWVSYNGTIDSGDAPQSERLIDGGTSNGDASLKFETGSTDLELIFDFGPSGFQQLIEEFKWLQSTTASLGTWRFDGSTDAVNWEMLHSGFTLGGATESTYSFLNSTAYRFYRLKQTSGAIPVSPPWCQEIQFKITSRDPLLVAMPVYKTGDRRSRITVTTNAVLTGGVVSALLDGVYDTVTDMTWPGQSDKYLKFDFGEKVAINEAIWKQTNNASHGIWQWQGSNDDADYDELGAPFDFRGTITIGPNYPNWPQPNFTANLRGYRWYKLVQLSGATGGGSIREIEFREGPWIDIEELESESESEFVSEVSESEPPPSESESESESASEPVSEPASEEEESESEVSESEVSESEMASESEVSEGESEIEIEAPLPPQCVVVSCGL